MTTRHFCDYCGGQIKDEIGAPMLELWIAPRGDCVASAYMLDHICKLCVDRIKLAAPINQTQIGP